MPARLRPKIDPRRLATRLNVRRLMVCGMGRAAILDELRISESSLKQHLAVLRKIEAGTVFCRIEALADELAFLMRETRE